MLQFFGHLHPVLVHLPIGILLLACLFLWQSSKEKYQHLHPVIGIILLLGMISAIASCVTGWLLYNSGDYDSDSVSLHQWMGIGVALVSVLAYYLHRKTTLQKWQLPTALVLILLISITGHLGGSITHGSDYLSQPLKDMFSTDTLADFKRKPIANAQEAIIYTDIVEPILHEKCYSCHGLRKQKGRLRLDMPDLIMKGGKDGAVLVANNSSESNLIKRIILPKEDEHHMAPKEKSQLTEQEINFLKWWIDNGADFSKKIKDFPQPTKIKSYLVSLQSSSDPKKPTTIIPTSPVEIADETAINKLKDRGVVVLPVAQNSNYLSVDFITVSEYKDSLIRLLLPLKKQLIWLKLSNTNLNDDELTVIAQCTNLIRLELDHTPITDKGLGALKSLGQLQSLNLVGTKVTSAGIMQLKDLKQLTSLYLFQTNVNKEEWQKMKQAFPKTIIDSGGYEVPLLSTDTIIVKPMPMAK